MICSRWFLRGKCRDSSTKAWSVSPEASLEWERGDESGGPSFLRECKAKQLGTWRTRNTCLVNPACYARFLCDPCRRSNSAAHPGDRSRMHARLNYPTSPCGPWSTSYLQLKSCYFTASVHQDPLSVVSSSENYLSVQTKFVTTAKSSPSRFVHDRDLFINRFDLLDETFIGNSRFRFHPVSFRNKLLSSFQPREASVERKESTTRKKEWLQLSTGKQRDTNEQDNAFTIQKRPWCVLGVLTVQFTRCRWGRDQ